MLGIRRYKETAIDLWQGDLTQFSCDVMVNAANSALAGGGGVDGAIHRVGGPEIMQECRSLGGCSTGDAVVTAAGRLPAKWVVHAVGPIWKGGTVGEAEQLSSAYRASLVRSEECSARHVASAAISTGVYGYPVDQAAQVAMSAVRAYLDERSNRSVERVTFVLFSKDHYQTFQDALRETFPDG